jgi:signal transduction histidine kinase
MALSFDVYGRRSLETRYLFYLTVAVLIMMVFCGMIVVTGAKRSYMEEAATRAAFATDRVLAELRRDASAAGTKKPSLEGLLAVLPAFVARGCVVLDPQIKCVAVKEPRGTFRRVVGAEPAVYGLPEASPEPSFDVRLVVHGTNQRNCWAFRERRPEAEFVVVIDSGIPEAHIRWLITSFAGITALTLVVYYFLALVMARSILRPMRQFISAMGKVTEGKFGFSLQVAEKDEVGQLKAAFNYMQTQLRDKEYIERQFLHNQHLAAVGHLAAGVAHEIRNPLASINSLTGLIASDPAAAAKTQEYARVILREVQRMNSSIEQLLKFSRPVPPDFAPGLISKVVQNVVELMQHEARSRNAQIVATNRFRVESPMLLDASKLEQLFINLVKNALEAKGEGGRVGLSIDYDEEADTARVTVEDDGPGIPEENKARLFDPFYSTKQGGSGLGLAIVSNIIAIHNGQIQVDTEVGRGTRFTILLPRLRPDMVTKIMEKSRQGGQA